MATNMRFKIARTEAGVKQHELADAVGVPEYMITRIECGRCAKVKAEVKLRIAERLGKRPFEIFDD